MTKQFSNKHTMYDLYLCVVFTSLFMVIMVFILRFYPQYFLRTVEDNGKYQRSDVGIKGKAECKNPSCVRCLNTGYKRVDLIDRLEKFETLYNSKSDIHRIKVLFCKDKINQPYNYSLRSSSDPEPEVKETYNDLSHWHSNCNLNYQKPTVLYFDGLQALPWHDVYRESNDDISFLQNNRVVSLISQELDEVITSDEGWSVNESKGGHWKLFYLYNQGIAVKSNCMKCPETFEIVNTLTNFMKGSVFGNAFFSVLFPGTHIIRHTGPTNCRLRCHLPITGDTGCYIEVASEKRTWDVNSTLVFDDSFPHSVTHSGTKPRVVFIVDLWHPDLTKQERNCLSFIFK